MKHLRGAITLEILESLQLAAATVGEIADIITYCGKDAHYRRLRKLPTQLPERRPLFAKTIGRLREQQRINKMIYKLQSQGLVSKTETNRRWGITSLGTKRLSVMQDRYVEKNRIPEKSNEVKIITFDIPENRRSHREWLREALKNLGCTMLQRSVWIGNVVIPETFVEELRSRDIFPFVEILAVTKSGTLKQLNK